MAFYEIHRPKAASGSDTRHAEILIYSEIGWSWSGEGVEASQLARELRAMDVATIDLRLNSPGGSMFDGNAIYNAVKRHPANVTVYVDGLAASAASAIAMAGDRVVMAPNAMLMIHDPWGAIVGNSADMREAAETFDKFAQTLVAVYSERSGLDADAVREAMRAETWYTADEAVAAGLADAVDGEAVQIAALARYDAKSLARYEHPPERLVAALADRPERPAPDAPTPVPVEPVAASSPTPTVPDDATLAHTRRVRDLLTRR